LRNAAGQLVADAYLMVMDYNGVNYDYNDNMFLITNIKAANGAVPASVGTATTSSLIAMPPPTSQASTPTASATNDSNASELLDGLAII